MKTPSYFPNIAEITGEWRVLIQLGLPLAIAEISGILLNVIDTAMIGGIGASAVASVSIATSVFMQVTLLGIGTMVMSAPLSATALEQSDDGELKKLLVGGTFTALFLASVLCAILCFANLNFEWLGQTAEITAQAKGYLWAITPNVFFLLIYIHFVHFSNGLSLTYIGMGISFFTLLIHIFINWLLIYGNWGFAAYGIVGAGVSTSISQGIAVLLAFLYIRRLAIFKRIYAVKIGFSALLAYSWQFFKTAAPVGIQIEVEYLAWAVGAIWVGWLGTTSLAAHQIAVVLATSTFMIMLSIGTAASIRIGQAAADVAKMRLTGIAAMTLAFLVILLPALSFLTVPHWWASRFISDVAVIATAMPLIAIAGFFQFFDSIQAIALSLLRGRGDTQMPSVFSLIAYWAFGMPIGYALAFHYGWNVTGVWTGFLLSLLVQTIFFSQRFFRGLSRR